ncbi:hypothetical protein N658DRAFT_403744, partial [Parathielavia hyrcaniae]
SNYRTSGRGGAGNMTDNSKAPQQFVQPEDLQTPTLKTSMVTTGRGGTGNFISGLDAEEKRRRQDVEPVVRRDSHGGMMHVGRGGTGNVAKADESSSSPTPSPQLLAADKGRDKETLQKVKSRTSSDGGDAADDDVAVPARKPEEAGWAEKGRNLLFGKK